MQEAPPTQETPVTPTDAEKRAAAKVELSQAVDHTSKAVEAFKRTQALLRRGYFSGKDCKVVYPLIDFMASMEKSAFAQLTQLQGQLKELSRES